MTHQLPDDWKPPRRRLMSEALDKHPHLAHMLAERDAHGMPKWEDWVRIDPEDDRYEQYILRPVPTSSLIEPIVIATWLAAQVDAELADLADAQTFSDEGVKE
jgi:hypothetical protein